MKSESFIRRLNPLNDRITEMNHKVDEAMKSISFISSQYDEILLKLKKIQEEKEEINAENKRLKTELLNATNELNVHKEVLNNVEQYSRRDCLEIRGIPIEDRQHSENTNEITVKVGNALGVEMDMQDISTSHRLPAYSDKYPPAIIVKFVRRDLRDQFYRARKELRGKNANDMGFHSDNRVYIVESLTPKNKDLFKKCLEAKREMGFKFIWTNSGKILLRKDDRSRCIHIPSIKELNTLIESSQTVAENQSATR